MESKEVISQFKSLSQEQQKGVLHTLQRIIDINDYESILSMRGDSLDVRSAECPYCDSANYCKNGNDKGCRRYKCKDCKRTFTEYTGTWINGIHRKELIPAFLRTMERSLSLKRTSKELEIAELTAFNWRHKFLSATQQKQESTFKGITEADETFYTHSQKGKHCTERKARKRGGAESRGISDEQAAVLTTMDRNGNSEFNFTNMGRISENDIIDSIGERVTERTILCTDGHKSYKAFTTNLAMEHHVLNASKKERVKGEMHIQHINSLHSRIRHFFNYDRRGVSTKYLQKYLNWQKTKEMFGNSFEWIKAVLIMSMKQPKALEIFENIENDYNKIFISTQFSS
jgi:transposase-like protein